MTERGWFVDILTEDDEAYIAGLKQWGVFLQLDGCVTSLSMNFFSEADATKFLLDEVIGKGLI